MRANPIRVAVVLAAGVLVLGAVLLDRAGEGGRLPGSPDGRRTEGPVRSVIAIDVSQSMSEPIAASGTQRIEAAVAWAAPAVTHFAPSDELALWTFPTRTRRGARAELEPATPEYRDQFKKDLKKLQPGGGTPLYDTIAEGVEKLQEDWRPGAINALVVLTDGDDNGSKRDLDDLKLSLDAADETKPVRVLVTAAFDAECKRLAPLVRRYGGGCVKAKTSGELLDARRWILESLGKDQP